MRNYLYLSSAIAACLFGVEAHAQTPTANAAGPGAEAGAEGRAALDEIVVTAQRRSQNLQDVPIAVTAFSGAQLTNKAITNSLDLNMVTPGVNSVAGLGFFKPYIRGIGSTAGNIGLEAPVATYVDGVYLVSTPASILTFMDVQRIEVLKGPQGTLFGRNATGGLINVITKDPTRDPTFSGKVSYGNYDTFSAQGYASSGITQNVALGLAGQYSSQGKGYGTNVFSGRDVYKNNHDFSVRGKLLLDFDRTQIRISGDYFDRDTSLFAFSRFRGFPTQFYTTVLTSDWDANTNVEPRTTVKGGGGSVKINQDLGSINLMSLTAYRKSKNRFIFDADASPQPLVGTDNTNESSYVTQELQLQSDQGGRFTWTAGLYYLDEHAKVSPNRSVRGGFFAPLPTSIKVRDTFANTETSSIAGYAEGRFELTDRLSVTGGVRYTREKRKIRGRDLTTLVNNTVIPGATIRQSAVFKKATVRAVVDYKFNDDILVYASYNTGFKSGGFNPSFYADVPFDPESIKAFEVGLKSELADRRIRLNLSGFHYDYKNVQVNYSTGIAQGITNGAAAEIYGLDGDLDAVANEYLTLNAGIQLLHSKYTDFPKGIRAIPKAGGGFTQQFNVDLSGNRATNAPKFTFNLGGDLHTDTTFGELGLNAVYYHNSGYFAEPDNLLRQKAYDMVNITARWVSPSKRYNAQLWVKNLTNETVANQLLASTFNVLASYQPPRTYGVTLGVDF